MGLTAMTGFLSKSSTMFSLCFESAFLTVTLYLMIQSTSAYLYSFDSQHTISTMYFTEQTVIASSPLQPHSNSGYHLIHYETLTECNHI